MTDPNREPRNANRLDLYRRLLPSIQEQDQASGAHGFSFHWDDPDSAWDDFASIEAAWDHIGLSPIYQELFYTLENRIGDDLAALESLDALTDPLRCPEEMLHRIAASFGYALERRLDEATKRAALIGLIDAFKARGTFGGFKVFYRLIGFEIINIYPLWKKAIHEEDGRYSRVRYITTPVTNPVGPAGVSTFTGRLPDTPVKPHSLRFTDTGVGGVIVRDEEGSLIGPGGESGSIDYTTGDYTLNLTAPAIGAVQASYLKVTDEYPYHAARLDLEINISPGGVPIPLFDTAVLTSLFVRMEETRPIHVLLRTLSIVSELQDTFGADGISGATDRAACVSARLDHRDGVPFPGPTGRDYLYILDMGTKAEDDLRVDHASSGTATVESNTDEILPIACPLDTLVIHRDDGPPDTFW
jgi:hypothetical protein